MSNLHSDKRSSSRRFRVLTSLTGIFTALAVLGVLVPAVMAQDAEPTKHPFLWRIDGKNGKEFKVKSWFLGTMHLGDDRLVTLPEIVEKARDNADALYCELAMDQMMKNQLKLTKMMLLPKGETLETILPEKLYGRLDAHLKRLGASASQFKKMKIWAVSIVMAQLDASKQGMLKSLDMQLYTEAKREGKEVGGLETLDEQMGAIGGGSKEDHIESLRSSLDFLDELQEKGQSSIRMMLEAYLTGNETKLLDFVERALGDNDELNQRLMKPMLEDRNRRMVKRVDEKLMEHPEKSYFFAVGAMHFIGDDGMLTMLRKMGYQITRMQPPKPSWQDVVKLRTELQKLRIEVRRLKRELEAAKHK